MRVGTIGLFVGLFLIATPVFAEPVAIKGTMQPTAVPALPGIEPAALREEAKRALPLNAVKRGALAAASKTLRSRVEQPVSVGTKAKSIEEHAVDLAKLHAPNDQDIMPTAFLILMEASKSAREDLKAIMAKMKAINAAKKCKTAECASGLVPTADYDKATLDSVKERMKGKLDSLSEMGEMESLRLQMAMDRMSKMMSALSNIMKKLSDTSSNITQNLK